MVLYDSVLCRWLYINEIGIKNNAALSRLGIKTHLLCFFPMVWRVQSSNHRNQENITFIPEKYLFYMKLFIKFWHWRNETSTFEIQVGIVKLIVLLSTILNLFCVTSPLLTLKKFLLLSKETAGSYYFYFNHCRLEKRGLKYLDI